MKKFVAEIDKRELLLVIGRLAGAIELSVKALEKTASHPSLISGYFVNMCNAQIEEAQKTWVKFICFIWLAADWKTHSMTETQEEISKVSISKFLEIIYQFAAEVDQGIKDLWSIAEWLIEEIDIEEEYPLANNWVLGSMLEAISESETEESVSYLKYAERVGYFSEAQKVAYECLTQANELEMSLREFTYFIKLAIESFDTVSQLPMSYIEFPLFKINSTK